MKPAHAVEILGVLLTAHHHAATVLAKMPRQVLHALPQVDELPDAGIARRDADLAEVARQRLGAVDVLEAVHQLREPIHARIQPRRSRWAAELPQIQEWFDTFGEQLPAVLWTELDGLRARLGG